MSIKACVTCGLDFHDQYKPERRYCSKHCAGVATAARRDYLADHNPRWRGGTTSHPLYAIYMEMIGRCERSTHKRYPDYGGRGIRVDRKWRNNFWWFVADVGPRPEGVGPSGRSLYSLDRIDNDGNYQPDNVRWATHSEQSRNRRAAKAARARDETTGRWTG